MTEEEDEFPSETFMSYAFEVKTIRALDDMLLPTTFKLSIEMAANPECAPADLQLALDKLIYWRNLVGECVMLSTANANMLNTLVDPETHRPRLQNLLMLLPDDPDEEMLAMIFQSKFNALADDVLMFGAVDVEADTMSGISFAYVGDARADLPQMDEWVAGGRNWFAEPWWARDDASMLDTVPPEGADLTLPPAWAYSLDFLAKPKPSPGNVVVTGTFKPTVIDGGPKT